MREELAKVEGERHVYTATFKRFGRARGYQGRAVATLLLIDVRNARGEIVTDHLWFKLGKQFAELGLKPGDKVRMEARAAPYSKGYRGQPDYESWSEDGSGSGTDFKLAFPTRVEVIADGGETQLLPLLGSVACSVCGGAVPEGEQQCSGCERKK